MFGGRHEIKPSTMHVEASTCVISGRGFNSRRLHQALLGAKAASDLHVRWLAAFFLSGDSERGTVQTTLVIGSLIRIWTFG